MKINQRIKIKDDEMARAWGIANEVGVIVGPDPRGFDKNVFAVKLDTKVSICEAGIHMDHLEKEPYDEGE